LIVAWSIISFTRCLDWRSDVSLWESAIAADPATGRLNLAEALWSARRYTEALSTLREEHDMTGSYQYSLFEGKYALLSGRYAEAIGFFQRSLVEGGEGKKELHIHLAEAYEKTGNEAPALEHYLKALEAESVDTFNRLAVVAEAGAKRMRTRMAPGLDILRAQAEKAPGNFTLQERVALAYHGAGLYEEAERFHGRALELNPSSWEAWYNLGLCRFKRHDYRGAGSSFDKALSLNRSNPEIINYQGACLLKLREYSDAQRCFLQALHTAPGYYPAAYNLGRLFFLRGDAAQARKYFATAQTLAAGNTAVIAGIRLYQNQLP